MAEEFIKVARPFVGSQEVEAVKQVLLSGHYTSGPKVEEFERKFANYIGTRYAAAVDSGTSAIYIALEAMGIKEGDEVIVPSLTFFATVSAVIYHRAIPVFSDIDPEDLCMSAESLQKQISGKTKAIIPVHLFGASAKMDRLVRVVDEYDIKILEDCAQAHGTEFKGRKVGSIGNAGAFSFFATKHMTTGEGGIITSDDSDIIKECKCIRNHGMSGRDDHVRLGFNNRMTEISAAIGLIQLEKLDELNEKRIRNSEYLIQAIRPLPWAKVPIPAKDVKHTFFWCPLMIDEGYDKSIIDLKKHLSKSKIGFRHRYTEPLYKQPVLRTIDPGYAKLHLPNAEKVAGEVIGLPNHPGLSREELDRIIEVLHQF